MMPTGVASGYAGVYHERDVSGWQGYTGFYIVDARAIPTPDEEKTWAPILLWADPGFTSAQMDFSWEPDTTTPLPANRRLKLELLYVPDGITGAPAVGTVWDLPRTGSFLLTLPVYKSSDGLTGYQFAFRVSAEIDPCEAFVRGDSDCDGDVDFDDINPFVAALTSEDAWAAALGGAPTCDYLCANDIDGNGVVDFDDINPFVACLTGACQ